jgi:hypothetical protein
MEGNMSGPVTRNMIDAGMRELPTEFIGEMPDEFWRELVIRIFKAMQAAERK